RYRWSEAGTRFLLYPQDRGIPGFEMPRVVRVTARPGTIKAGPEDRRLYVVDALRKKPYRDLTTGDYLWRPPYPKSMPQVRPVRPSTRGEFDHPRPGTRHFSAATAYASVRCVLEIWEYYLGRRIALVGKSGQRKLEIIPRVTGIGDNAWSGEWYIELGFAGGNPGRPYCENLDVIAHEVGHIVLKHVIGPTPKGRLAFERRAHDEAGADLVSLVTILHFDRVVDSVLAQTRGKLFSVNILSQIGEYRMGRSGRRTGRLFFQNKTMRSVARARRDGDKYVYARPLLGAAFDILVEIYEARLVRRGLITQDLADRSTQATAGRRSSIRREFAAQFVDNPDGFADALREATADFARLLAFAWRQARRTGVTFSRIASNIAAADARLNRGRYAGIIRRAFGRRRIAVRVARP
ncbi:MAG: hypothetical protein ACREK4_25745, partial [Candidatus Rokuibacteriota bacterium]